MSGLELFTKDLVKFDGTNWTVYNTSNSPLSSNWVGTIAVDHSGKIWVGTSSYAPHLGELASFDGTR